MHAESGLKVVVAGSAVVSPAEWALLDAARQPHALRLLEAPRTWAGSDNIRVRRP